MEPIVRRNIMHAAVGCAIAALYYLSGRTISLMILGIVFALGTLAQYLLSHGYFITPLEAVLSYYENEKEKKGKRGYGAQMMVLGSFLAILLFESTALPAILVLAFGDSFSAIVGSSFKSSKIIKKKTILGSIAFFLSAFFVLIFFYKHSTALIVALAGAVIEQIPIPDDNVSVPLGVAALLSILGF